LVSNFFGYEVKQYFSDLKEDWKEVLQSASNATLMHERSFLAYHSPDKFEDFSVMMYRDNLPVAVFPAHREDQIVHSHKGLSYGGLIHKPCSFNQKLAMFKSLLRHFESLGIDSLQIKETPSFYNLRPDEATTYLMHLLHAKTIQMELSLAIKLPMQVRHKGRKANLKQAAFTKLEIQEANRPEEFWDELLLPNLTKRYQTKPTHSKQEMAFLMKKFPENIRQFNVYKENSLIAGATIYFSANCLHTQYLASNELGRNLHALDALVKYLCENQAGKRKYFDFGHSNENNGTTINPSLFRWKESFGASAFIHRHYLVPVGAWHKLDKVLISSL
jgi:hypothetical protein